MRPLSPTTKIGILLCVICLLLLAGITASVHNRIPKVTILDARFRVSKTAISDGPAYTNYAGNQLVGRLRDRLAGWGLPVNPTPKSILGILSNQRAFFVYYSLSIPHDLASAPLEAELVDQGGAVLPLRWFCGGGGPASQDYWSGWALNSPPTSTRNYVLRLKLPAAGSNLAEIKVGK
jgi:hypothetical protein